MNVWRLLLNLNRSSVVAEAVGAVVNAESAERFPRGCGKRGVFGAFSKRLWETCGKTAPPAFQAQRQVFHILVRPGSFHSLSLTEGRIQKKSVERH